MYALNARQSPALFYDQHSDEPAVPLAGGVVRDLRPAEVAAVLPKQGVWEEIADGATAVSSLTVSSADPAPTGKRPSGLPAAPEPSSGFSLVMAASGLGVVTYLWSIIIF